MKGRQVVEVHLDVAKFFDHISRFPLAQTAATMGYPMDVLRVSLSAYSGPRRIAMDDGLVSERLWAADGVMAGSPHAVYETVAYLSLAVRVFQELHPSPHHHLTVFVDDIALQVAHEQGQACLDHFLKAAAWLFTELEVGLGLPIERDKTVLLSSCERLLAAADKGLQSYSGSTGREVRKLGGCYSLQHRVQGRPPLKMKMARDRITRALRRHQRISALAGTRTFGTVFHTGVLQEAAFGTELCLVSPQQVARLRKAAVRAHGLQGVGIPHQVSLLAMPLDRDPRWHIDLRILSAFHREVWNLQHAPHEDHLSLFELARLFSLPEPPDLPYRTAWKDPMAALHDALKRHGIQWKRVTIWEYRGMDLHLQYGTPAVLPRILRDGARARQVQEADFPGAPEQWNAAYLLDTLGAKSRRKALTLRGKKALLAYMKGRFPTRTVLARWGYQVDVKCPHCGGDDTAFHRIFQCDLAHNIEHMNKRLAQWKEHPAASRGILQIPPPPLPPADLELRYQLFGVDVSAAQFGCFLPEDGPVYIDGSVVYGKTPFASGGWAVVQVVGGRVSRSIRGTLDRDFPATSDFAEHVACHHAANHVREGSAVELVTDCASVVSYFHHKKAGTVFHHGKALGGVWLDIDIARFAVVHKVKSHLSYEAACARNMGQWWQGNAFADALAQEAALQHSVPKAAAVEYLRLQRWAGSFLRDLTAALLKWDGDEVSMHDCAKVAQGSPQRRVRPRHDYEWLPDLGFWACRACWKRRLPGTPGVDRSGCQEIAPHEAGALHPSHSMKFAHGPWGSRPLMYCTRCGHYSTSRLAHLRRPCAGSHNARGELTSAYRLYKRTICHGKHPVLRRFVLGHRYTPHCQWQVQTPVEDLGRDMAAARAIIPEVPVPASGVANALLELEQLEEAAAMAAAGGVFEEDDPFALGEDSFLGLDSP
jgi:hypothetical protein